MAREILFDQEVQEKIQRGVNLIADCVAATMGPSGQCVAIENTHGFPSLTKDGVTVARHVDLKDKFEKLGADLVKEAANKTNEIAGDGTTTATVLARALYNEGHKLVVAGENPVTIKKQIEESVSAVLNNLTSMAVPVDSLEKLENVASIAANDKELGKIIAGLMYEVGKDGLITVEENPSFGIETELTKGMKLDGGFISSYMVTNAEKMVAEMSDCPVFVCDRKITLASEILPLLEAMAKQGKKELLIIADNVEGEALAVIVVNKQRGVFNCVAQRCPGVGDHRRREQMRDICAMTGATLISEDTGKDIKEVKLDVLGKARHVIVSKDYTTIVGGYGKQEDVDLRIGAIKSELASTKSDYDEQKLKERLGQLTGSVGVIKVGGTNEVEIKEKKQRVEDSINATRAAQEEGIIVGGGIALLRASAGLDDRGVAGAIVRACQSPLKTIAENAGKNGEVVLEKCLTLATQSQGYNAVTDTYEDLMAAGIIDPLKVTRTALENASSIATMLLTTRAALVMAEEKK